MPGYSNEQLMTAFKMLPNDVREAILSVNTAEVIKQTADKYKLMIDKAGQLADETGLVMLGLTHPNQFIADLAERLEIDKKLAKEIAEEINSRIFFPVRENLKKIHQIAAGTLIPESEVGAEMPTGADLTEPPPFDKAQGKPFDKAQGKPFDEAQGKLGTSIFEEKTKEEVFRSAIQVSEKNVETAESASSADRTIPPPEPKKPDPYRETT